MKDYDEEIENLEAKIEKLKLERSRQEDTNKRMKENKNKKNTNTRAKEKTTERNSKESEQIVDSTGRTIRIGDSVHAVTKVRFRETEGTVKNIRKWVTFEDRNGVKQTRAPYNLRVQNAR